MRGVDAMAAALCTGAGQPSRWSAGLASATEQACGAAEGCVTLGVCRLGWAGGSSLHMCATGNFAAGCSTPPICPRLRKIYDDTHKSLRETIALRSARFGGAAGLVRADVRVGGNGPGTGESTFGCRTAWAETRSSRWPTAASAPLRGQAQRHAKPRAGVNDRGRPSARDTLISRRAAPRAGDRRI